MTLAAHLNRLETAGLIRELRPGPEQEYLFRHALVQEAAYHSLLHSQRRQLHRAVGEALERLYHDRLDEMAPDLAQHFYEAEAWDSARHYFVRAGEAAAHRFANREAVDYYTRAIEVSQGNPPPEVYRARGLVQELLGNFEAARADLETALRVARASGQRRLEWQILLDLGLLWAERDYERSGNYCHQAYELAQQMNDPALLAHSLNRLGNWHLNIAQAPAASERHQTALQIFQELDDRHGLAETLDLLGMTNLVGADLQQSADYYQKAIDLNRALGRRRELVATQGTRLACAGGHYMTKGTRPAMMGRGGHSPEGEAALETVRQMGWRSAEAFFSFLLAAYLGPRGAYRRALECAQAALDLATEIGHRQWMAGSHHVLGALLLDLHAYTSAVQHLEAALELARATGSSHWTRTVAGILATGYISIGDLQRAADLLNSLTDLSDPPRTIGERIVACAHVELALARGAPDQALDRVDTLIASASPVPPGETLTAIPVLSLLRGEALIGLGRFAEAEHEFRAGQAAAQAYHQRALLWRLQCALGRLYKRQDRQAEAAEQLALAQHLVDELAASLIDADLRETFLQQADLRS